MTDEAFRTLVRDMRAAQTQYFATRSNTDLRKSIAFEHQVDAYLADNASEELTLFPLEAPDGTP